MTPSPLTSTTTAAADTAASASSSAAASSADSLANEQVFLQLLVAQLKYQDPDSPADGTQFVTQLAQFADLEQVTQSRTDLDAIKQQLTTQPLTSTQTSSTSADPQVSNVVTTTTPSPTNTTGLS